MYITIAGAGLVGRGLVERLVENKHDVVVIDIDEDVCDMLYRDYGVVSINGNATDISVLEEAEIRRSDVAVALMGKDSDNLSFSLLADNMGADRVVARMRNTNYRDAFKAAGVDRIINIVELHLDQFTLEIEQPKLQSVTTLGGGKASIVIVVIPEGSKAAGKTIAEVTQAKSFPDECVVAGIYRRKDEEFIIPRGNRSLQVGDRVFLAAAAEDIKKASNYLGVSPKKWFSRYFSKDSGESEEVEDIEESEEIEESEQS